jgi:hypothetical protein
MQKTSSTPPVAGLGAGLMALLAAAALKRKEILRKLGR